MRSVQYALQSFGVEAEDWRSLRKYVGPPLLDSFRDFCGFDEETCRRAVLKYRERYNVTGYLENSVYEGIPELLKGLKASGKRLMVATSKPEGITLQVLEHFDLKKYFTVIVGSEPDGRRDRKAEVIEEVFRRAGIEGDERRLAVMIGDRLHDIRGARECGIDSLGTYIGYAQPGELEREGADYIAHSVEEMREILL